MLRYCTTLLLFLCPLAGVKQQRLAAPPTALKGVDVSHYQKRIEWDMVAAVNPVDFAFVKATEGHDFIDSLFCRNWEYLQQMGIRRGAYHFFRAYGCGDEQATHFLSLVDMHPGDLAPVLDIERTDGIPTEIMLEEAHIWLKKVESALNIKPIIYTNQHFYDQYLAGQFDQYPLWIARYSADSPRLADGKLWDIWQYSNEGCIDGISEKVDLNVFSGTPEMFDRLCWYPAESTGDSVPAATP
jgi:lysozyme